MESDTVIYGLLGRIHLLMRRVSNRITDVEYMRVNKDYAREIVRLAREAGNPELADLAARLTIAMALEEASVDGDPANDQVARGLLERLRSSRPNSTHPTERYVGSLR